MSTLSEHQDTPDSARASGLRWLLRIALPLALLALAWQWLLQHADLSQLWQQALRLGKDIDGNPVYLATSRYNLEVTAEKWPKVTFHATREHGEVLG